MATLINQVGRRSTPTADLLGAIFRDAPGEIWIRAEGVAIGSIPAEFPVTIQDLDRPGNVRTNLGLPLDANLSFYPHVRGAEPRRVHRFNLFTAEITGRDLDTRYGILSKTRFIPSFIINAAMVTQAGWIADGTVNPLEWMDVEWLLTHFFDSDPAACDPARPLLLPGFGREVMGSDGETWWDEVSCDNLSPGLRYTVEQMRSGFAELWRQFMPGFGL